MPQAPQPASTMAEASSSLFHTKFLIPNLHCPSCITHTTALMDELDPPPTVENISIVDHVFAVAHHPSLSAASIARLLELASYEVFDVILDPSSTEAHSSSSSLLHGSLDDSLLYWNPAGQSENVDDATRAAHADHCQMCAAVRGGGSSSSSKRSSKHSSKHSDGKQGPITVQEEEITVVSPALDKIPRYTALLSVTGMTCGSCVGNVTRALEAVPSTLTVEVALISNSARVQFHANDVEAMTRELMEAIEAVGYYAEVLETRAADSPPRDDSQDLPSTTTENLWEAVYAIEGMSCAACVGKIARALRQLAFVQGVDINLAAQCGTVNFHGRENAQVITSAIAACGYENERVEMRQKSAKIDMQTRPDLAISRTVSLRVSGVRCPQCPRRIRASLQQLPVHVQKEVTIENPVLTVTYTPTPPAMTLRTVIAKINSVDPAFKVSVEEPRSLEARSRIMLARERKAIARRAILSTAIAIPTLTIGVIYMNLVSKEDAGYRYLMHTFRGISRAEWATFILATPVYFFGADYFHRRMLKEIYALWRPRSSVPISQRFYRFGSMNMLVSLGTSIAYFASLAELIVTASRHRSVQSMQGHRQSYFDSVVFLTMFLLYGKLAEAQMKAKSGDAVAALGKLRPTQASLVMDAIHGDSQNGGHAIVEKIDVKLLDRGDVIRVLNGSTPPADGTLLDHTASFDESSLTGESRVIRKVAGDMVYSGTVNAGASAVNIRVTGPAGASMLDSIIQVIREGQGKRAPMERIADLLTAYFVPMIVLVAIITFIIWLALGISGSLPNDYLDVEFGGWAFWSLQFAIAVFVVACPCGLGLAAPTALYVGGGMAAQRGILVKGGGEAFQEASRLDAVVFDKTGTLTQGGAMRIIEHRMFLDDHKDIGLDEGTVLGILMGVECDSTHPLAKAAVSFASGDTRTAQIPITTSDNLPGKGIKASCSIRPRPGVDEEEHEVLIGNESLMVGDHNISLPREVQKLLEVWKQASYSVILLAHRARHDWNIVAIFAASDPLRPESAEVVHSLQLANLQVWMLSGDNPSTAYAIGSQLGIPKENILAGVLPAQKAEKIKYLQRALSPRKSYGRGFLDRLIALPDGGRRQQQNRRATVAMIGDGINDAPALAAADVGIAVASGSDVAVQSAAFILVHSDLRSVLHLIRISRAVFRRVIWNFCWAAVYNVIALPVAAGMLFSIRVGGNGAHVRLDPVWAALAMALSSISVIGSSLLLRTRLPIVGTRGGKENA